MSADGDFYTVVEARGGQAWAYKLTAEQLRLRLADGRLGAVLGPDDLPGPGQPAYGLDGDGGTLIFRGLPVRMEAAAARPPGLLSFVVVDDSAFAPLWDWLLAEVKDMPSWPAGREWPGRALGPADGTWKLHHVACGVPGASQACAVLGVHLPPPRDLPAVFCVQEVPGEPRRWEKLDSAGPKTAARFILERLRRHEEEAKGP